MEFLILMGLSLACFILWQRVNKLEQRLEIAEQLAEARGPHAPSEPRPEPRPAPLREAFRHEGMAPRVAPLPEPEPKPEPQPAVASPAPAATPAPAPKQKPAPVQEEAPARRILSFEDIFGRYLPIWAGGITLAVAGFLIVKYSIDAGLLSPAIRVVLGLLFGTGLIVAAEIALRKDAVVGDARIRQALSGAGIATLYASILVAANLYHLIGPMSAFIGLALVTALAAGLSLRFGAPSAVLGLVGGFAAPALVGSTSPNIPLLATYLALTVGGLCALGRSQRWWWLGALAVLGGFGWGALLILGGLNDTASILAIGTLTLLIAVAFPMLLLGDRGPMLRLGAALAGCAQMAALVAAGGYAPLEWGLFGLLSAAIMWLSRRQSLLTHAPMIGLGTGVLLTMAWFTTPVALACVIGGGAIIYGGPALWRLWRSDGTIGDAIQLAGVSIAIALIPLLHFHGTTGPQNFTVLALGGSAIAAFAAALGWRHPDRLGDMRFALVSVTAIGLALLAAGLALPGWALAPATAAAALAALMLGMRAQDARIGKAAHGFAIASLLFLSGANGPNELIVAMGVEVEPTVAVQAFIRWLVPAIALIAFARWSILPRVRPGMQAGAVLLGYIAAAQLIPATWLALIPAALILAFALIGPRDRAPIPALATAGALSLAWAAIPLVQWLAGATQALVGEPLYATALPALLPVAIRIAAPALAIGLLLWRKTLPDPVRSIGTIQLAALGIIVAHILWKQVFGIADPVRFNALGMAERTLWEAILAIGALAAWRLGSRRAAIGLGAASGLHFGLFTLLLHNPLWDAQAVGPWLLPAYGIAFALVLLSRKAIPGEPADRARGGIQMALILAFAMSALAQIFHGTWLMQGEVTQAEDISRSLLAIALAIGFLQWGIRRAQRDWRIASLVLMLGAVGKVFLFDAAGLDGLLRIASFAALGFSLIGVGWLYSRYLPDSRLAAKEA
jgi:uncharacterized membrane protein